MHEGILPSGSLLPPQDHHRLRMAGLVEQMIKSPARVMVEHTPGAQVEKGNTDGIRRYARHCLVDKLLIQVS